MSQTVLSLNATSEWQGNDGNWSTFRIQVGFPPVNISVLPATSGGSTWVVDSFACQQANALSCGSSRGGLFDPSGSRKWKNVSTAPNDFFELNFGPEAALNTLLPSNLQYAAASLPGTDDLTLEAQGSELLVSSALIALYTSELPYLGVLGLSGHNETVTSSQDSYYSVLGYLNASGNVSGSYYGYTAGADYRQAENRDRATGSLTFGGYDASRGNVNNTVTVPFSLSNSNRTLGVAIQEIVLRNNGTNRNVFTEPIVAQIDSVVPEIWLPRSGCQVFEDVFGLVWNETVGYYLVSDETHNLLLQGDASVSFVLTADVASLETTTVVLPYSALQPMAGWPLLYSLSGDTSLSLRYFPVRRSQMDDQFYLGRTFLQEAYLAVDYDKKQLHISPATFPPATAPQDLRFPNGTALLKTVGSNNGSKLSGGAIAGTVVGAILAVAALLILIAACRSVKKRRRMRKEKRDWETHEMPRDSGAKPELDGVGLAEASRDDRKPELDSTAVVELDGAEEGDLGRHELEGGQMAELAGRDDANHSRWELDGTTTAHAPNCHGGGLGQL